MASLFARSEPVQFFYLWGMLKDEVNGNDPCTHNYLKKSIQNAVSSILPTKLNMFVDVKQDTEL